MAWQNYFAMELSEPMKFDRAAAQRAERLRAIRERLHGIATQRQFAARLGVSRNRYTNWELGHPIPSTEVKKIRDITPGIDADWILWGDESGLTVEALKKLSSGQKPEH